MDALQRLNTALAGRYDVEREIGAGGMATVYLARDPRHNRRVALKVLRPDLGAVLGVDRFLSEIQVTANLQHPNLLPLFDSGEADGLLFYVMPFVEGESLRARLDREKQLPLDDAIRIATAVASALDYAHRHGVIHRDLKPENILLHEGQPVVADFGIALAVSNAGGGRVTQTGISLGTPQYMSPEQATGDRAIDARTDIYSLGAVAYEMLTGEPPHLGNTAQAIIARVVTERPRSVRITRSNVPEHVNAAVERALEKLPADRWATAQEFADALNGKVVALPTAARAATTARRVSWREAARHPFTIGVGLVAAMAAAGLGITAVSRGSASAAETIRFELTIPESQGGISLQPGMAPVAVSPNGRLFVYRAVNAEGAPQLYIRELHEAAGRPISGSEGAANLAFSPTGNSLAFTAGGALFQVSVSGSTPSKIADIGTAMGLVWTTAGFVIGRSTDPLEILPTAAATPRELTALDESAQEIAHRFPVLLPDGKHLVFLSFRGRETPSQIGVASLRTGAVTYLDTPATGVLGYAGGLLILHDGRTGLIGVPFDTRSNRVTGSPVPLVDSVSFARSGLVRAALSPSGTLVYVRGGGADLERELVSIYLDGKERALTSIRREYGSPRYAPDWRRVAVEVHGDSSSAIWTLDLGAGTIVPTTRGFWASRPAWSPDGRDIAFLARDGTVREYRRQPADGTAPAYRVISPDERGQPVQLEFSPDGRHFVFRTGFRQNRLTDALWYRAWDGDTTVFPFATDSGVISRQPAFSPGGKWVAYASDESGSFQVYIRPFPGPGPRYAVSVDGGDSPVWSPDGRQIYYVNGPLVEEATVSLPPQFSVTRRPLFQHRAEMQPWSRNYDIAPDGSHFIFARNRTPQQTSGGGVVVIHNWGAHLERMRRAATAK